MIKLYKKESGKLLYWETWESGPITAMIHTGVVGELGQSRTIQSTINSPHAERIEIELQKQRNAGFSEIAEDDHDSIVVEYAVSGMGTVEDLDKRGRLEDLLQEILGWRGLGHCDGGSMGSGSMECFSYVVDFEIAKSAIENALSGTEFSNYTKIYRNE